MEAKTHQESSFVTLTYDQEHLPLCTDPDTGEELGTLKRSDLQAFLKRIQRLVLPTPSSTKYPGKPGRYYACAEYGTNTARPHYHINLFGLGPRWFETIDRSWTQGFVSIRPVDRSSLRYTLKYCLKNESDPESPWLRGRQPTFALMSKRPPLGISFLPLVAAMLKKTSFDGQGNPLIEMPTVIRIDGELLPMDRTLLRFLKGHLNLEQHQEAAAFPKPLYVEPEHGKQAQALIKHSKAWRNRKAEKAYSI